MARSSTGFASVVGVASLSVLGGKNVWAECSENHRCLNVSVIVQKMSIITLKRAWKRSILSMF